MKFDWNWLKEGTWEKEEDGKEENEGRWEKRGKGRWGWIIGVWECCLMRMCCK